MAEVLCDMCAGFQPLEHAGLEMRCGLCGCTVGRVNPWGRWYCEDCRSYQSVDEDDLHPPFDDDRDNAGYLLGHTVCVRCRGVLQIVRVRRETAA